MSTRGKIIFIFLSGILLLALTSSSTIPNLVLASPANQSNDNNQVTIAYPGRLNNTDGQPVIDGEYTFAFNLYQTETGEEELWSEVQEGVLVKDGTFLISLGSVNPLPTALLDGRDLWLSTNVRGRGETEFTALEPRQLLSADASTPLSEATAGVACPHDHVGEVWEANIPWSNGALKILNYGNGPSIWGWNGGNGNGIRGYATGTGVGVYGESVDNSGVLGRSTTGYGVEGASNTGYGGVYAHSVNGVGLFAHSDNNSSIYVDGAGDHGVYVASAGWSGVSVWSAAVAGMWVHSAGQDGVLVETAGWDGVHVVGPVGGTYYGSGKKGDEDFAVLNTGEVRSKIGFTTPANDYAVMLDTQGEKSDYEPGDVLIISGDQGQMVELSTKPSATTVIGVYSASPGFLGGQSVTGQTDSDARIPVAIMGIASVKVSTENGSIQPGDLLVTSSTPGYAMRADNPIPGTILGKALGSLESGTGMVFVLLTLQ
jgi:hypothetical protein